MDRADWINLAQGQGISACHLLQSFHLPVINLATISLSRSQFSPPPLFHEAAVDSARYHFNALALTHVICLKSACVTSKKAKTRHFLCGSQQEQMTVLLR